MKNCPFCRILSGTMEADKVYEDDTCIAFRDTHPQAPHHVLVVPRLHIDSLNGMDSAPQGLLQDLMQAVREVARRLSLDREGYRVVINTGPNGGQTVFHLHLHLLGGRPMHWPPG